MLPFDWKTLLCSFLCVKKITLVAWPYHDTPLVMNIIVGVPSHHTQAVYPVLVHGGPHTTGNIYKQHHVDGVGSTCQVVFSTLPVEFFCTSVCNKIHNLVCLHVFILQPFFLHMYRPYSDGSLKTQFHSHSCEIYNPDISLWQLNPWSTVNY